MDKDSAGALASLTANYTDSDDGSDHEDDQSNSDDEQPQNSAPIIVPNQPETSNILLTSPVTIFSSSIQVKPAPPVHPIRPFAQLVSYTSKDAEKEDTFDISMETRGKTEDDLEFEETLDNISYEDDVIVNETSPSSLFKSFQNSTSEDIQLPPEPNGRCSNHLQEKIAQIYQKKKESTLDMNHSIQKNKSFRNPSIYEKLISFVGIDEFGSNYPTEIYDPHSWKESSFYEELAKAQKAEMDKRQKERTKVEFISGTAKKPTSLGDAAEEIKKRKSKWDIGSVQSMSTTGLKTVPSASGPTHPPGLVPLATVASGTKATVISAFGTISKKSKQ